MTKSMEIQKENGNVIKMELVTAGAAHLTEMDIVKMNKFGEATRIGYYTVNNKTGDTTLTIYVRREEKVSRAYGAPCARKGIAYKTVTKTKVNMKQYKSDKAMAKVLAEYGLTVAEVKAAMNKLTVNNSDNNMIDWDNIIDEYIVSEEAQFEAMIDEIVGAEMSALNKKIDENPDLKMRAAIQKWMPTGKAAEEEKTEDAIKESVSEQIAGTIEGLEKIWTANLKKNKKFRQNSMELNLTIKLLEQLRAGARLIERAGVQSDSEIKFKMDLSMKRIVNDLIAKGSSKLKTDCKIKDEADKTGSRLSVKENSIIILAELAYQAIKMRIMEAA